MIKNKLSVLAISILCSSVSLGQDILKSLNDVQKIARKHTGLEIQFKQEIYTSTRGKVTKSDGTLVFSPPKLFRWEVIAPHKEIYTNNGKEFWKYSEVMRHAQKLPSNSLELDFLNIIFNLGHLSDHYGIEVWKPAGVADDKAKNADAVVSDNPPPAIPGHLLLKLIPKKAENQQNIFAVINEKQGIVEEMRIVFKNGNRTRISFENMKSAKIDPVVFSFVPPQGTAVDKM